MFYIYLLHFGIIIFVPYPKAVVRRCSLWGVLKNFANLQENVCTGVSFLSATSNFINEETLAPDSCFLPNKVWVSCLTCYLKLKCVKFNSRKYFSDFKAGLWAKLSYEKNVSWKLQKKKKCISLAELGQIWHHEFGTVIWEIPKLYNI